MVQADVADAADLPDQNPELAVQNDLPAENVELPEQNARKKRRASVDARTYFAPLEIRSTIQTLRQSDGVLNYNASFHSVKRKQAHVAAIKTISEPSTSTSTRCSISSDPTVTTIENDDDTDDVHLDIANDISETGLGNSSGHGTEPSNTDTENSVADDVHVDIPNYNDDIEAENSSGHETEPSNMVTEIPVADDVDLDITNIDDIETENSAGHGTEPSNVNMENVDTSTDSIVSVSPETLKRMEENLRQLRERLGKFHVSIM